MQEAVSEQDGTASGADAAQRVSREVPTKDDDRGARGGDDTCAQEGRRYLQHVRNDEEGAGGQRGDHSDCP